MLISTNFKIILNLLLCNCKKGTNNCPMSGNCLTKSIVYQANVTSINEIKQYIGLASTTFKERLYNHHLSFNNERYEHSTHLSKYIWELKRADISYKITWSTVVDAPTYHPTKKNVTYVLQKKFLFLQLTIFSIVERKFFKSVGTRTSIFYAMLKSCYCSCTEKVNL